MPIGPSRTAMILVAEQPHKPRHISQLACLICSHLDMDMTTIVLYVVHI